MPLTRAFTSQCISHHMHCSVLRIHQHCGVWRDDPKCCVCACMTDLHIHSSIHLFIHLSITHTHMLPPQLHSTLTLRLSVEYFFRLFVFQEIRGDWGVVIHACIWLWHAHYSMVSNGTSASDDLYALFCCMYLLVCCVDIVLLLALDFSLNTLSVDTILCSA
jgi:hypothetical protein